MQGTLHAKAGSILVFIDETGHEEFADPKHPVFGLGGCLLPTNGATAIVDEPWRKLKQLYFPDYVTRPFHIAEIRNATSEQAAALGLFFRSTPFRRFACVVRASADNPDRLRAIQVTAPTVMQQISRLLKNIRLTSVHIIWEDSERLNRELDSAFRQLWFTSSSGDKIPITYSVLPKVSSEPGLEIADCIIHTAGCQVRNNMSGKGKVRRDFQAIFQSRPETDSEFVETSGFKYETVQRT